MEREYIDGGNDDLFGNNDRGVLVTDKNEYTRRALQKEKDGVDKKIAELQSAPSASPAGLKDLAAWDPYDQTASSPFFDSQWMFCVERFCAVVGNPPYGAKTSEKNKAYYKAAYPTCRTEGGVKGSTDTFAVFINRGLDLIKKDGVLSFIVPMSVTSSDSMGALHKMMFETCRWMRVVSLGDRPKQIFTSSHTCVSLVFCAKTLTPMKALFTTKIIRRSEGATLQDVVDSIRFVDSYSIRLNGRLGRVGLLIGRSVLEKLFMAQSRFADYREEKGKQLLYYRVAGGLYYKTITTYATGSTQEKGIPVKYNKILVAFLSSSLFWFYWDVYGDGLHLKQYEMDSFPLPNLTKLSTDIKTKVEQLCDEYLADIERNVRVRTSSGKSSYKVATFKEYKIRKSKAIIDRIDDLICPLYGLTAEETAYVKGYEAEFRMEEEKGQV